VKGKAVDRFSSSSVESSEGPVLGGPATQRGSPGGFALPLKAVPSPDGIPKPNRIDPGTLLIGSFSLIAEVSHHRGTFEVMLLLHEQISARDAGMSAYQIRRRLRLGQEAIYGALRSLLRLGLVDRVQARSFPFGTRYHLTQRGEALVGLPLHSWSMAFFE